LISLRKQIDESERFALRFQALLKAFLGLTAALPKAALPADTGLSSRCKEVLDRTMAALSGGPQIKLIDEAGRVALQQFEETCRTSRIAMEERDSALKEVVATVAGAVSHFKGQGERHQTCLSKLADGFDVLSNVQDATELRRRLLHDVSKLRESVEEMRRESEQSVLRYQSQISTLQQRLEKARKEAGADRLTGLGSRREAERRLQEIPKGRGSSCLLLYDIDDFRGINQRNGTVFGDKLLCALTHILRAKFPEEALSFAGGRANSW